jgi:hypothetical protein
MAALGAVADEADATSKESNVSRAYAWYAQVAMTATTANDGDAFCQCKTCWRRLRTAGGRLLALADREALTPCSRGCPSKLCPDALRSSAGTDACEGCVGTDANANDHPRATGGRVAATKAKRGKGKGKRKRDADEDGAGEPQRKKARKGKEAEAAAEAVVEADDEAGEEAEVNAEAEAAEEAGGEAAEAEVEEGDEEAEDDVESVKRELTSRAMWGLTPGSVNQKNCLTPRQYEDLKPRLRQLKRLGTLKDYKRHVVAACHVYHEDPATGECRFHVCIEPRCLGRWRASKTGDDGDLPVGWTREGRKQLEKCQGQDCWRRVCVTCRRRRSGAGGNEYYCYICIDR